MIAGSSIRMRSASTSISKTQKARILQCGLLLTYLVYNIYISQSNKISQYLIFKLFANIAISQNPSKFIMIYQKWSLLL